MSLVLPKLILRSDLDIRERLILGDTDAIPRRENKELEKERRSSAPRSLVGRLAEAHRLIQVFFSGRRLQVPADDAERFDSVLAVALSVHTRGIGSVRTTARVESSDGALQVSVRVLRVGVFVEPGR